MNEPSRQAEVADQVEAAARKLVYLTRTDFSPPDSSVLLRALESTIGSLVQVAQQLASWHDEAVEGVEYSEELEAGGGRGAIVAAQKLRQASMALDKAAEKLAFAHGANRAVRWNAAQERGDGWGQILTP